jgi:hypothetical protein
LETNIKPNNTMKLINTLFLATSLLSFNGTFTLNNELNKETLHAHDVKFSVIVNNGGEVVANANLEVFVNGVEVSTAMTNELGKADLLVKDYKHEKVTLVTSHPDHGNDTTKNMTLTNGKFYYVNYGPVIEEVEKNPKEIIMDVVPPVNQTAINKANEEATRKIQQEKS